MARFSVQVTGIRIDTYCTEPEVLGGYGKQPDLFMDIEANAAMVFTVEAQTPVAAKNKVLATLQKMIQERLDG